MTSAQTRLTLDGSSPGTPEYMSPEQARGDQNIDHRADLYSAGVVLYEMLTGRTPFSADTPSAVIHRILTEEPVDPRTVGRAADPHLASLALRLMAKRPPERFESAGAARAALDSGQRIRSVEKRRRHRRYLVAGFLASMSFGVGAWLLKERSEPPAIVKVWSTPEHGDRALRTIVWTDYVDGRTKSDSMTLANK